MMENNNNNSCTCCQCTPSTIIKLEKDDLELYNHFNSKMIAAFNIIDAADIHLLKGNTAKVVINTLEDYYAKNATQLVIIVNNLKEKYNFTENNVTFC